jgi:hypothetical protein
MNISTLIIEGHDTQLNAIEVLIPLSHVSRWTKGDPRRFGKVYASSGFSVIVADTENPGALVSRIREFLASCIAKGLVFSAQNLTAELSIGFTVGDSEQYVAGIEFSPTDLSMFAECGIALSVTAYPTSDEANAA